MRPHDPPEILTLSLELTVLKVKSLFPNEPVSELLQDMIEPPSEDQLAQAIEHLKDMGALTKMSSTAPQSSGDTGKSSASASIDDAVVTFLGGIVPSFPCDVAHTRLLVVGLGLGIPTDAVVLAAAMAAQDPFSLPTSFWTPDRAEVTLCR